MIGFQRDLRVNKIDVYWDEVWADPQKAMGLYVVTAIKVTETYLDAANRKRKRKADRWFVADTGIDSVEVVDGAE